MTESYYKLELTEDELTVVFGLTGECWYTSASKSVYEKCRALHPNATEFVEFSREAFKDHFHPNTWMSAWKQHQQNAAEKATKQAEISAVKEQIDLLNKRLQQLQA